jgi:hypothetical protein
MDLDVVQFLQQFHGIILLPSFFVIGTEVVREGLLTPRAVDRVGNGRKG